MNRSIWFNVELIEKIKEQCKKEDRNFNEVVNLALRQYYEISPSKPRKEKKTAKRPKESIKPLKSDNTKVNSKGYKLVKDEFGIWRRV